MIHSSSHLIYVTFRLRSFYSTRLIIFVLFFTDIVSWWFLLRFPASMILTTSAMSVESFWMSSKWSTPSLKGTSSVRLTRRTLEFKWGTRTRVGWPHGLRKLSVHSGVVVQREEMKAEVWNAKNLSGTNRSHKQLLLFYGGSDWLPQGKKDGCVRLPKSAIISSSGDALWEASGSQPSSVITIDDCTSSSSKTEDACDNVFAADDTQAIPHFPNHAELNDLIRVLGLTKSKTELLTSWLKQWNLLDKSCRVTRQRQCHYIFSEYFILDEKVCYCHDINGLFEEIEFLYDPSDWRLFVDSSARNLKVVLLHNGIKYPSIPITHSVHLKEGYENVKHLLRLVKYKEHDWEVIGDFKMIRFLTGLQGSFIKHPCFSCYWDSRATARHYETKDWPSRAGFVIDEKNVKWKPLAE